MFMAIAIWDYDDPALPALRKTPLFRRLRQICCEATGSPPAGPLSVELDNLVYELLRVSTHVVPAPEHMVRPLERALAQVQRCIDELARLDRGCRALIRSCTAEEIAVADAGPAAADGDRRAAREAAERELASTPTCLEQSVAQLTELKGTLRRAIDEAHGSADNWRPSGRHGRGARPDRGAYEVADRLVFIFERYSGNRPTFWNDPAKPTPFGRLVRAVFDELEIEADIRRPVEWALKGWTEGEAWPPPT
jgi:hypothetical protein